MPSANDPGKNDQRDRRQQSRRTRLAFVSWTATLATIVGFFGLWHEFSQSTASGSTRNAADPSIDVTGGFGYDGSFAQNPNGQFGSSSPFGDSQQNPYFGGGASLNPFGSGSGFRSGGS